MIRLLFVYGFVRGVVYSIIIRLLFVYVPCIPLLFGYDSVIIRLCVRLCVVYYYIIR